MNYNPRRISFLICMLLNLGKAVQLKPKFEIHAVYVYEKMDIDLMQLKQNYGIGNGFYKQLHRFFIGYLEEAHAKNFIHGDIKPRLTFEN